MKKIALIVQRYGLEINGGSEAYARMIAEKLVGRYEVHVITTCAIDYLTWNNEYPVGEEAINGVTVHRFKVDKPRSKKFDEFGMSIYGKPHSRKDELKWMDYQGPQSLDLIQYVRENVDNYDVFFGMTYLYYPTFHSMPIVGSKCVFFPTAHDELYIYLEIFAEEFRSPKAIAYLTNEERDFVQRKFSNQYITSDIIGVGIDPVAIPENLTIQEILPDTKKYVVYVGRIDESKGCLELANFFLRYVQENSSDLSLVFVGKSIIDLPKDPRIVELGFVSEEEKTLVMKHAMALMMSSRFESLSLVTLESMLLSVPVLANGNCEVLKGHCIRSNGGLYYHDYAEFEGTLRYMEKHPDVLAAMGENSKKYVEENYTWPRVMERLDKLIEAASR